MSPTLSNRMWHSGLLVVEATVWHARWQISKKASRCLCAVYVAMLQNVKQPSASSSSKSNSSAPSSPLQAEAKWHLLICSDPSLIAVCFCSVPPDWKGVRSIFYADGLHHHVPDGAQGLQNPLVHPPEDLCHLRHCQCQGQGLAALSPETPLRSVSEWCASSLRLHDACVCVCVNPFSVAAWLWVHAVENNNNPVSAVNLMHVALCACIFYSSLINQTCAAHV